MLLHLHVKNFALIDEAEVDFTEGLNILTGETGAGKSVLLGSVNLALGAKLKEGMNAFSNTKLGSAVSSKVNSSAGAQKVKNAVGRIGDQANKISKQAKKFSDKVRTITYTILHKDITNLDVIINDVVDQAYTGSAIKPVMTVTYNNQILL